MKFTFPILRENTCMNGECEHRIQVTALIAAKQRGLLILRLVSLMIIAGWLGGSFGMLVRGQTRQLPSQATVEQFEIQDLRSEVLRLHDVINAQGSVITDQGKEIARMNGIGIGLGLVLLVLQVAQTLVIRNPQK